MKMALAIFAPYIGARSETFIRRHMTDVEPGATVVVADSDTGYGGHWSVSGPKLVLHRAGRPRRWVDRMRGRSSPALGETERAVLVRRFVEQHAVTVAVGEFLDWSHQWLPVVERAGIRFFAHAHGYDVSMRLRETTWRSRYRDYQRAAGVITMSVASRARLIDLGLRPDAVHVIPYGVDVPPAPIVRPARETIRCLAVGRLVPKKAPLRTLEAFRLAAARRPAIRLDMIGGGELLSAADEFVSSCALKERVRLLGPQPPDVVDRAMREADIFVQHSATDPATGDEEGLPVSILEAMAHALPVIATRHAGIPEAVRHRTSGLLVDEGDVETMAEYLIGLADDAPARARLGRAAWTRAEASFSWERERRDLRRLLGLDSGATQPRASAQQVVDA